MTARLAARGPLLVTLLVLAPQARGEDAKDPAPKAQLKGHKDPVWTLAFGPDGKTLTAFSGGFGSGKVMVWEVATGKRLVEARAASRGLMGCAAVSRDGKRIAGANGKYLYIWKADGEPLAAVDDLAVEVTMVAFSPDGKLLAVAGGDLENTMLELRDAAGKSVRALDGHAKGTSGARFTPDGKTLVSAGADGTVRLWEVATGKLTATLEGHGGMIDSLAIRADGKQVATGDTGGVVRLWDLPGGKCSAVLKGHPGTILGLDFSPDGKLLAVATGAFAREGQVWLWDTATGKGSAVVGGQDLPVRAVAFSPDGKTLASVCGYEPVLLWDVATLAAKIAK